jgi:hypothetical protein
METPQTEEAGLNIEEAADQIGADLFNEGNPIEHKEEVDEVVAGPQGGAIVTPAEPVITAKAPPSSWAKDTHELWGKMDPKAQEYIEKREKQMLEGLGAYKEYSTVGKQYNDILMPYQADITAQGLDGPKVVQVLMNAHHRLSRGTPQERASYLVNEVARTYGIDLAGFQPQQPQQMDPALREVMERQQKLETALVQRHQEVLNEARERTTKEVNAFAEAKDEKGQPINPYFEEVADDIIVYIDKGLTLDEAYKRAVRANPVTWEKEVARIKTEHEQSLKTRHKGEAEAALKAKGPNVRGRDTRNSPTESLGTMEDTMKKTLAEVKARTH